MLSSATSLPSIKFLLSQSVEDNKKPSRGHRASHSVSSLPTELQNLSLDAPKAKDDSALMRHQDATSFQFDASKSPMTPSTGLTANSSTAHAISGSGSTDSRELGVTVTSSSSKLLQPMPLTPSGRPSHHQRSVSDLPHLLSLRQHPYHGHQHHTPPPLPPSSSMAHPHPHPHHTLPMQPSSSTSSASGSLAPPFYRVSPSTSTQSHQQQQQQQQQQQPHSSLSSSTSSSLSYHHHAGSLPPSGPYHAPGMPLHHSRKRHQTHRRAVSATTVDHLMHPPSSSSTPPPVPPIPWIHRAHSNSPPESHLNLPTNAHPAPLDAFMVGKRLPTSLQDQQQQQQQQQQPQQPQQPQPSAQPQEATLSMHDQQQMEELDALTDHDDDSQDDAGFATSGKSNKHLPTHAMVNGMHLPRDMVTGRYLCPFCKKAFSRPSSLRIHTHSHTGEKPFVCTEKGCGRRFSVQSNMRRHLRVHRLGRKHHYMRLDYTA